MSLLHQQEGEIDEDDTDIADERCHAGSEGRHKTGQIDPVADFADGRQFGNADERSGIAEVLHEIGLVEGCRIHHGVDIGESQVDQHGDEGDHRGNGEKEGQPPGQTPHAGKDLSQRGDEIPQDDGDNEGEDERAALHDKPQREPATAAHRTMAGSPIATPPLLPEPSRDHLPAPFTIRGAACKGFGLT